MVRPGLVALLVAVGVFAAADGAARTTSSAARDDEDAIRAVMAATTDAFSRHDAKAWAKLCTPDAQLVTVRGESMKEIGSLKSKGTHDDLPDQGPQRRADDTGTSGAIHPA